MGRYGFKRPDEYTDSNGEQRTAWRIVGLTLVTKPRDGGGMQLTLIDDRTGIMYQGFDLEEERSGGQGNRPGGQGRGSSGRTSRGSSRPSGGGSRSSAPEPNWDNPDDDDVPF